MFSFSELIYRSNLALPHANSESDSTPSTFIYEERDSSDSFSIFYTNADGLMNKRDELRVIIVDGKPDIIVVTEIFPKSVDSTSIQSVEMKIDGYRYLQSNALASSRGVGIYYKNYLSVDECQVLNNHNFAEICWCVVKLSNEENLLLGGIYRSP